MKKSFLVLLSFVSFNLHAADAATQRQYLGEWTCLSSDIRHDSDEATVDARFVLKLFKVNDLIVAEQIIGHAAVGVYGDVLGEDYYSVFKSENVSQNPNYRPRVYTNHFQFRGLREVASNNRDGGGMNGDLVISNTVLTSNEARAHYVFQSGDHLGGTIDYDCKK
jgi:hypothetical protein